MVNLDSLLQPGLSAASQAVTGEMTRLRPSTQTSKQEVQNEDAKAAEDKDGLDAPIGFSHLFQGLTGDLRRRYKFFSSDYSDGLRWQTLSAGLFTYFGVLATTISLGYRVQVDTRGQTGFLEYMLMNSVAGLVYATVEAQPYVVVQPTGPITMLLTMLSECAEHREFEFLPFVAATGLFVCIWLTLASALNVSRVISYMSRFTGEVFAVFIGTAYMREGVSGLVTRFSQHRSTPSRYALLGNPTNTGDALMSLNIGLLVFVLASWLATGLHGPRLCVTPLRNFFSAYSLTLAIAFVTLLSHIVFDREFTISYLNVPDTPCCSGTMPTRILVYNYIQSMYTLYYSTHYPNGTLLTTNLSSLPPLAAEMPRPDPFPSWVALAQENGGVQLKHSWWVGLPAFGEIYAWALLYSIPIVIFFFVDQLVSAGLAQPSELRMKKGRYFHSGIFFVGILNLVGPLLGLPFVTGALPQSPELTIQMAETSDEREKRLAEEAEALSKLSSEKTADESKPSGGLAATLLGGSRKQAATKSAEMQLELDRRPLVIESRLAPLLAYFLIFGSFMVPEMVNVIPAAAVEGTLIYIGLTGIFNTQLWQRVILMLSDWRLFSKDMPFSAVRPTRMHLYTLMQISAILIAWGIQVLPPTIGLIFPLWILSLVPARIYLLPHIFSQDELAVLDPGSESLSKLYSASRSQTEQAGSGYGSFDHERSAATS